MSKAIDKFSRYLVMYGPEEDGTGIKGIRADAPKEVIDEFIEWYRDTHRYENGRKYNRTSARIRALVIETSDREGFALSKPIIRWTTIPFRVSS